MKEAHPKILEGRCLRIKFSCLFKQGQGSDDVARFCHFDGLIGELFHLFWVSHVIVVGSIPRLGAVGAVVVVVVVIVRV